MRKVATAFLLGVLGSAAAAADFVPGRLYYSFARFEGCVTDYPEEVWEFDPVSGTSRRFATIASPGCTAGISGLAFTPDGRGLRVSAGLSNSILEIDGDGNYRTVYDYADGVSYGFGANNITFDAAGNFYVSNGAPGPLGTNIIKFPAGGTTGEPFAHVLGSGPLVSLPDGYLYFGSELGGIDRIAPDGSVISWDAAVTALAMTTDSLGSFYVLGASQTEVGVFRYRNGSLREFLGTPPFQFGEGSTISGTNDPFTLIVTDSIQVWSLSTISGAFTDVGAFGIGPGFFGPRGAAFYVPEPSAALNLLMLVGAALAAREKHRTSNKE